MSQVTRHYKLPVASTESVTDPKMHQLGTIVTLYFDFFLDGIPTRSAIIFQDAIAMRTRNERFSSSWNVKAFDTLTEIHESDWKEQIRHEVHVRHHDELAQYRHFAIYLDSAGSFEVLSSDFEVLPEESGTWESI